jgi:hypothetical protein
VLQHIPYFAGQLRVAVGTAGTGIAGRTGGATGGRVSSTGIGGLNVSGTNQSRGNKQALQQMRVTDFHGTSSSVLLLNLLIPPIRCRQYINTNDYRQARIDYKLLITAAIAKAFKINDRAK